MSGVFSDTVGRAWLLAAAALFAVVSANAAGIDIDPDNPRYWRYDGRRIVLIGGSGDDNLFQMADLEAHLDLLVSVGGNYVRNTMSSRDDGNLWPFRQGFARDGRPVESMSGFARFTDRTRAWLNNRRAVYPKYDLREFDPEYWRRFETLLRLASERGIVVQIEVWDRFDYARGPWLRNPFNPMNNVNYTSGKSNLLDDYPEHPGRNRNAFFRTVPSLLNNARLLGYQHALVDQLLLISLEYDNVLYTISNETTGDEPWSAYWAAYIKSRAAARGKRVYVTEMWGAHDLAHPIHARTFDRPDRFDFVEVSQNNHQVGQAHWDNLVRQRRRLSGRPRPMNNVKIYGADGGRFESTSDAVDRFWRSILGGSAAARFHRPERQFGLGLGDEARRQIASAAALFAQTDITVLEPQTDLLAGRDEDEAYAAAAQDGSLIVIFFPRGGDVVLPAADADSVTIRWLAVDQTRWREAEQAPVTSDRARVVTPDGGRWVAVIETGSPGSQ